MSAVIVVGGGLAGLLTAYRLTQAGHHVAVREAAPRWGGMIAPVEVAGLLVDSGAEAYATRGGHGRALSDELGLEVAAPEGKGLKGRPVKRPHMFLVGIPQRVVPRGESDEQDGEIYVADLIGMSVVHVDGGVLGAVKAAHDFGAALARMHDAGADYFGSAPAGYTGTCYFGPLQDPVPMDAGEWDDVATYLAEGRLRPMVQLGMKRRELTDYDMELTEAVIEALPEILGKAANDKPARVHGDLWSGNVMWSADSGSVEAVLIDPAAHGGHREEDLAMLDLFGMSYLRDILDGYQSVHPLKAGWQERTTLWQLYPIAGHCVFFGGGYVNQYRAMCRSLLK